MNESTKSVLLVVLCAIVSSIGIMIGALPLAMGIPGQGLAGGGKLALIWLLFLTLLLIVPLLCFVLALFCSFSAKRRKFSAQLAAAMALSPYVALYCLYNFLLNPA